MHNIICRQDDNVILVLDHTTRFLGKILIALVLFVGTIRLHRMFTSILKTKTVRTRTPRKFVLKPKLYANEKRYFSQLLKQIRAAYRTRQISSPLFMLHTEGALMRLSLLFIRLRDTDDVVDSKSLCNK